MHAFGRNESLARRPAPLTLVSLGAPLSFWLMHYLYRWYDRDFPSALDWAFKRTTHGLQPHEIPLFEALQLSFEQLTDDFTVDVFHGSRSHVTYSTTSTWANSAGIERCELCDLLLVSFRSDPFVARFTCLQNKADKWVGGVPKKFGADLVQLELLSRRPDIAGVSNFKPPKNLLSGALLPSVGSYGVFYRDAGHDYSMAYRVASDLQLPRTSNSVKRRVGDLLAPSVIRIVEGHAETAGSPSTYQFAMHLASLRIGTPIHGTENTNTREHGGYRSNMRNWLRITIASRMQRLSPEYTAKARRNSAATRFLELLGGSGEGADGAAEDGPTIVIVQTDGDMAR